MWLCDHHQEWVVHWPAGWALRVVALSVPSLAGDCLLGRSLTGYSYSGPFLWRGSVGGSTRSARTGDAPRLWGGSGGTAGQGALGRDLVRAQEWAAGDSSKGKHQGPPWEWDCAPQEVGPGCSGWMAAVAAGKALEAKVGRSGQRTRAVLARLHLAPRTLLELPMNGDTV